jgi:hypothetical protein
MIWPVCPCLTILCPSTQFVFMHSLYSFFFPKFGLQIHQCVGSHLPSVRWLTACMSYSNRSVFLTLGPHWLLKWSLTYRMEKGRPLGFGDIKMQCLLFSTLEKFDYKTSCKVTPLCGSSEQLWNAGNPFVCICLLCKIQISCNFIFYRMPTCRPMGLPEIFLFSFACSSVEGILLCLINTLW